MYIKSKFHSRMENNASFRLWKIFQHYEKYVMKFLLMSTSLRAWLEVLAQTAGRTWANFYSRLSGQAGLGLSFFRAGPTPVLTFWGRLAPGMASSALFLDRARPYFSSADSAWPSLASFFRSELWLDVILSWGLHWPKFSGSVSTQPVWKLLSQSCLCKNQ